MSISSKQGGGSRASDEDGKPAVSVQVGGFSSQKNMTARVVIAEFHADGMCDKSCKSTSASKALRSGL